MRIEGKIITGRDTLDKIGAWLFSKQHTGSTVIAHNLQSYDGVFLVDYMVKNSIIPYIIYRGAKIMYIQAYSGLNMRLIDSLNFLPMRIAKLPSESRIEKKKRFFPQHFNIPENQERSPQFIFTD